MRGDRGTNTREKTRSLLYWSWAGLGALLLPLQLFFSRGRFACKREFPLPNWLLLALGCAAVGLLWALLSRRGGEGGGCREAGICCLLFFFFQLYLVRNYAFGTDWDVGQIVQDARARALGRPASEFCYDYSRFPNNILITACFSLVYGLGFLLGGTGRYGQDLGCFLLQTLLCALSCASGYLCRRVVKRLTGRESVARLCFALYLLLIGLSPWVSIPYSESMGLLFPVLLLELYLSELSLPRKWLWIGLFSFVGYKVKPTVFILPIAMGMAETGELLSDRDWRSYGRKLCCGALGLGLGALLYRLAYLWFGAAVDREQSFSAAHFFMMGLNPRAMGVYAWEDVEFSAGFATYAERVGGDLGRAAERLREMGLGGSLVHGARKLLTAFHDGSFAWGGEGRFFVDVPAPPDPVLSPFIRSFYYPASGNQVFYTQAQALWLAVLLLSFCAAFAPRRKELSVILLSLGGLTVYLLLFEVRARYLYIYAPLFIAAASQGFTVLRDSLLPPAK